MNQGRIRSLNPERLRRSRVYYFLLFILFSAAGIFLLASLRSLILPTIIGMLSAYIASPLLNLLRKKGLPKWAALLILFGTFTFVVVFLGRQLVQLMPNEREKLELRVKIQYKVNEEFLAVTGRDAFGAEGNFLYSLVGDELDPVIENFNDFIALDSQEKDHFLKYAEGNDEEPPMTGKVLDYFNEVSKLPFPIETEEKPEKETDGGFILPDTIQLPTSDSKIAKFVDALSNWIVLPFVFLFLLIDDGQIKRFLINLMPNRYFEMSLTIFDNVDTAIGNYLRGTLLQSSLVGLSFIVGLTIVGFQFQAAALIGILAGLANAIPFLGPILGLGIGLLYAMIVEGINPLIPFISIDPFIGVILVTLAVQVLDNTVFQPMVLGKAVDLHPLVVVIGVTGGSIILGFAGMLFAIPAIVVFKVVMSTIYRQLKLYYIIY